MKTITILFVSMIAGLSAFAQDWKLQPTFGTHEIASGFMPDPRVIPVVPGGDIDLATRKEQVGMNIQGFISNAPDVDMNYTPGNATLTIKVEGGGVDTILLVNAPDGRWWYVDDVNGVDPAIVFPKPLSGNYNIWVGTLQQNPGRAQVRLLITEL